MVVKRMSLKRRRGAGRAGEEVPFVHVRKPAPSLRSRMATNQMSPSPGYSSVSGPGPALKPISCADWLTPKALRPRLWPGFKDRLGPVGSGWGSADDQLRVDLVRGAPDPRGI